MSHTFPPADDSRGDDSPRYGATGHPAPGPYDHAAPGYGTPYGQGPQDTRPSGAPYPGGAPCPTGVPGGPVEPSERSMAMLAHLSMIVGLLLSAGWLTFVGPLVLWLVYKDRSPFVRQASAGAFNFSLAVSVASILVWLLVITFFGIPIALVLGLVVGVASIVMPILGAMRADKGQPYRYPLQIPVLH
ncbi:DUF4870 domain-containing protein [Mobilicoccus pelagius]|uniref:DUF4870 domain-containing protein n=1 Tax=Mobilicoccus pelagius NBRC 104925 TaxID=1089455 RepID=H5UVR6_9MICO|nr:DUF4870 domain-containing protein [Mobilicoccus pelagius]GAB49824.1 hypothetical protein MOPEL_135_00620 [Mobilicoccus pelagius NBRC 104925]